VLATAAGRSRLPSGISQIIASVVSMSPEIEDAFCIPERVILAGSMTPQATRTLLTLLYLAIGFSGNLRSSILVHGWIGFL